MNLEKHLKPEQEKMIELLEKTTTDDIDLQYQQGRINMLKDLIKGIVR